GAIYACMALAVVMIYQAIDHLNFAQGEMAMFSTFVSRQLMQWGAPYWGAFVITLVFSFFGGIAIERLLFKPLAKAPILTNVAGFIALFAIINSVAGLIWDFTIKQYPTPFGSSPLLGSQLISTQQAGMIGVTVMLLVCIFDNLAGTYIPGVGNELKLPIALALIITVLVVKPAGLFGRPIVKRV